MSARPVPAAKPRHRPHGRETGAAAVELAIVLPLLLFVLFAMIDFGRAFDTRIQLSQAAREGVRLVAMQSTSPLVARVQQAAPGLTIQPGDVTISYLDATGTPVAAATSCSSSGVVNARLTVRTQFTWITGMAAMSRMFGTGTFPTPTQESTVGVMQCSRTS